MRKLCVLTYLNLHMGYKLLVLARPHAACPRLGLLSTGVQACGAITETALLLLHKVGSKCLLPFQATK